MGIFDRFLGLFHRKQRFGFQYSNLAFLKKVMFFGATGFILTLSASKYIYPELQFYFQPSQRNQLLIKLNPALNRGTYHPSLWMVFSVFQRLYAKYRQDQPYIRTRQEQVQGHTVSWVELHDKAYGLSKQQQAKIPVVVVLSGSQGIDNTVRSLLLASYNLGYRVVAIDPEDMYDVGELDKIVNSFKQKHPQSQFYGVGVQYGANLLINYAAQHPKTFEGLVSVGNPFDLLKSELQLQESWTWSLLCKQMLKVKLDKAKQLRKDFKSDDIGLFEVQKYLYDVADEDYVKWKQQNSSINSIAGIDVPTLLIQSRQDPFTQKVEEDQRYLNQKCIYVTTQKGGHNQWFQNLWMHRWIMSPVKSFLKLLHEKKVEKVIENMSESHKTPLASP